jgi:hypothetical protein
MRNYWLKIVLGALAVFAVGMVGVTLARRGMAGVRRVVSSSEPLTIPLGLIPFELEGERLGKLDHLTLTRESPTRVSSVELEVNLADSLVARGLEGCRLAANVEGHHSGGTNPDIDVHLGKRSSALFYCVASDSAAAGDSTAAGLEEYGVARLQPGDIEIPLLLPQQLVKELQHLDFGKGGPAEPTADQADSIAAVAAQQGDSIAAAVQRAIQLSGEERRRALDSIKDSARRLGDSLRAEGLRQAEAGRRVADSARAR